MTGNETAEQNEEQELRALLVRVLNEPLVEMTKQLQDTFDRLMQEGVAKSSRNAIRSVEEDLIKPTNESLSELTEAIGALPRELRTESEIAISQMISAVSENLRIVEQHVITLTEGNFQSIQQSIKEKHQMLVHLAEMTKQLQNTFDRLLQEEVAKSSRNAIRSVEEVLVKPTNESIGKLTEAIGALSRELRTDSEKAISQIISKVGESMRCVEQKVITSIAGSFQSIEQSIEEKHQVLLRESEAKTILINGQFTEANSRSVSANNKLLAVCVLNLIMIIVFMFLFYAR